MITINKGTLTKEFIEFFTGREFSSFIDSCLMKESKTLIKHLILDELTTKEKKYILQKAGHSNLSSFRDNRNAIQYMRSICCSWLIEEAIKKQIILWEYKILTYGSDLEREILTVPNKIKHDPDILIEVQKNKFIKIEITQDYTDFVCNSLKYGFRYNKYQEIKEDNGFLLHICLKKKCFFFFHIDEIKEPLKIKKYLPFGGKPVVLGDIKHIPFYPFDKFKEVFLKKIHSDELYLAQALSKPKFKSELIIKRKLEMKDFF